MADLLAAPWAPSAGAFWGLETLVFAFSFILYSACRDAQSKKTLHKLAHSYVLVFPQVTEKEAAVIS